MTPGKRCGEARLGRWGFALALGAVAGCSGSPEAVESPEVAVDKTPIRLVLNWMPEPEFGGFYEGVLGGHYAEAGFEVTIVPGGPGAPTLELLGTGQAEVALTSAEDLLLKRAKGLEVVGLWTSFQRSAVGLMAHEARGLTSLEAIGDGTVAIEVGSPFQRYLWTRYGWEGRVTPVPYGGSVAPFLADPSLIQQAYITSEPCVAESKGAQTSFLSGAEAGWNPYAGVVAMQDPEPAWAADFVRATEAAWEAYMAEPGRANAEIARLNDGLDTELVACITAKQEPFVRGDDGMGAMTAARWNGLATALASLGLLPEGATAEGAWRAP